MRARSLSSDTPTAWDPTWPPAAPTRLGTLPTRTWIARTRLPGAVRVESTVLPPTERRPLKIDVKNRLGATSQTTATMSELVEIAALDAGEPRGPKRTCSCNRAWVAARIRTRTLRGFVSPTRTITRSSMARRSTACCSSGRVRESRIVPVCRRARAGTARMRIVKDKLVVIRLRRSLWPSSSVQCGTKSVKHPPVRVRRALLAALSADTPVPRALNARTPALRSASR
jgi:hypothetical protein